MSAPSPKADFEKWSRKTPKYLAWQDVPFFCQSTWPQYRKPLMVDGKPVVVDGEEVETHLDGTETADTVIVKYDHADEYKKWREEVMKQSLDK